MKSTSQRTQNFESSRKGEKTTEATILSNESRIDWRRVGQVNGLKCLRDKLRDTYPTLPVEVVSEGDSFY
jgi:hypothetical protein